LVAKEGPLAEKDLVFALAKEALRRKPSSRARFMAKVLKHPGISEKEKKRFKAYLAERPSRRLRAGHSAQDKKLARKLAKDPSAGGTLAERKRKERWLKEIRRQIQIH